MYNSRNNTYVATEETYRSRAEIKEEIRCIHERICEVNESLNIRELISDALDEAGDGDIVKKAERVTELLKYAEESLSELRFLNERLSDLKAELISSVSMCNSYERGEML